MVFFPKTKLKLFILGLLFVFISTTGLRCKVTETTLADLPKKTLNIWGVWETQGDLGGIIKGFQAKHPNVAVRYRQFRYSEYEKQILNARANRQEPDILFIHNTWLGDYQDKILPMPKTIESINISYEGTIKKDQVIRSQQVSTPTLKKIKDTYLAVTYDDLVKKDNKKIDQVYSLPLYVDSLVMFYNKDILSNAGIVSPPQTWEELQQDVKSITLKDTTGRIIQSGVALGAANNIERYFDILSLLMMQTGATMVAGPNISFNTIQKNNVSFGAQALTFYTDFVLPNKDVYTWDKTMGNSLDEFAAGKVAFVFGYSYHLKTIRGKNPKLNFEVAPMPQIIKDDKRAINYASYWTPVVFNTTKNKDEAWDFIIYASSPTVVDSFLQSSKRPPAIRADITKYENDFDLATFVQQSLTAQSWYHGRRVNAAEESFQRMIDKALESRLLTTENTVEDSRALEESVQHAAAEIRSNYNKNL